MATGIIKKNKQIVSKFYTVQVGTDEYYGWYYKNLNQGTAFLEDYGKVISIIIWDVTNTNPTFWQWGEKNKWIRIFTKGANTSVTVKVTYLL